MKCLNCGKEFEVSGPGQAAKFCKAGCRVMFNRKAKAPRGLEGMKVGEVGPQAERAGNTEESALKRLEEMKAKKAVRKERVERRAGAEFRGALDVYMPTVNDANISAMIGGKELPYPEGGAKVLRDLEVRKVVEKVEEVKPTF